MSIISIERELIQEILPHYLSCKDLCHLGQVSKRLNILVKNNWDKICFQELEKPISFKGSWLDRCKIIHNWKIGKFEKNKTFLSVKKHPSDFFVLDNGDFFEVSRTKLKNSILQKYSVKNLATNKIYDLGSFFCMNVYKDNLVCINESSAIELFDIRTGVMVKSINCKGIIDIPNMISGEIQLQVELTENEITVYHHEVMYIWDIKTDQLKKIRFKPAGTILDYKSTPNFIAYIDSGLKSEEVFDPDAPLERTVCLINKNTKDRVPLRTKQKYQYLLSSGNYIVLMSQICVHIFEDMGSELILKRKLPYADQILGRSMAINRNWLIIRQNNQLKVWNLKRATKHSKFSLPKDFSSFGFNDHSILIRILKPSIFIGPPSYKYVSYSFTPLVLSNEVVLSNEEEGNNKLTQSSRSTLLLERRNCSLV